MPDQTSWHVLGFLVGTGTSSAVFFMATFLQHRQCPLGHCAAQEVFTSFRSFNGAVVARVWCWVLTGQIINKTWAKASHGKWNPQHNWIIPSPWDPEGTAPFSDTRWQNCHRHQRPAAGASGQQLLPGAGSRSCGCCGEEQRCCYSC